MFRLFSLTMSFGLGFLLYAVLDKGKAIVEILPPSVRVPAGATLTSVLEKPHSVLVPKLRNLAETDSAFSKLNEEVKALQKKVNESNRLRSGDGIRELSDP